MADERKRWERLRVMLDDDIFFFGEGTLEHRSSEKDVFWNGYWVGSRDRLEDVRGWVLQILSELGEANER